MKPTNGGSPLDDKHDDRHLQSRAVPGLQSRAAEVFDEAYGSALIGDRKQPVLDAADYEG